MNGLEIEPVTGRGSLKRFVRMPAAFYADDPHWIQPLEFERLDAYSPKHPFFQHARWQAWVATRNGIPAGRISAQIDDLHTERYRDKTGFFGCIEAIDDQTVFNALFATAESWLREQGCHRAIGPFNLNINQELGVLTDGFDTDPFFMMGHARPYYRDRIQAAGYSACQELLAYELHTTYETPPLIKRLIDRTGKSISLRRLDSKNKARELATMRTIFNDAWEHNWNYVPFTEAEFDKIGGELLLVIPPDFAWFAEMDGEPVGFIVVVPNLNEAIRDFGGKLLPFNWLRLLWRTKVKLPSSGRVPLMGVLQRIQQTRHGTAAACMLIEQVRICARERNMHRHELSWILEDNANMRAIIERLGGTITKRYHMFEKTL